MAHLGMGTMFGMTVLGDPQAFLHARKNTFHGTVKDVPREKLLKLFVETGHFHNNINEVRRAILPQIFTNALQRQLDGNEIDLMLRYFPIQPGNMTYEEFERAVDLMKADDFLHPPPIQTKVVKSLKAPAREKTLNSEMEEMKRKHKRDVLGPTDVVTKPLTTNMEYGWETMLYPGESSVPIETRKFYFPKNGTDVTQAKGIEVKNELFLRKRADDSSKLHGQTKSSSISSSGARGCSCNYSNSYGMSSINSNNNHKGFAIAGSRPITAASHQARGSRTLQLGFIDIHRRPSTSSIVHAQPRSFPSQASRSRIIGSGSIFPRSKGYREQ